VVPIGNIIYTIGDDIVMVQLYGKEPQKSHEGGRILIRYIIVKYCMH